MTTKAFDYPYFGQHPWYAILLQDKFISCFSDEYYYLSVSGDKYETFKKVWQEFAEIVQGMTWGSTMSELPKRENIAESSMRISPITGMAFYHSMYTCPADHLYLSKLWHSMDDYQPIIYEKLRPVQLVVKIFYPFWHRMGIDEEEKFVRSGRLGYYLQLLKSKTNLPIESGEHL
jgi:hypothetical protein